MSWPIGITIGNLKRREQYMASNRDFIARKITPGTRDGADSLMDVARSKHAAAVDDPGADKSKRNVARAKRENWSDGSMPTLHTPKQ
jgi:hypothetical protein